MEIKNNNSIKGSEKDNSFHGSSGGSPGVQNFRTLQSDMVNAVKAQDRSLAQMIIADKKRKRESGYRDQKVVVGSKHLNSVYKIFLGFVVIVTVALFGIKLVWQEKNNAEELTRKQTTNAIIAIDEQITLDTKNFNNTEENFIAAINNTLAENKTKDGNILHLHLIKETEVTDKKTNKVEKIDITLPVDEFFKLWENNAPSSLIRSFEKEDYMFGFYNTEGKELPFLLFELKSFDQAFAGMLEWENNLYKDTKNIFQIKKECSQNKFKDAVLLNEDIRVLEFEPKKLAILYGFLDNDDVLIITQSTVVFEEIKSLLD